MRPLSSRGCSGTRIPTGIQRAASGSGMRKVFTGEIAVPRTACPRRRWLRHTGARSHRRPPRSAATPIRPSRPCPLLPPPPARSRRRRVPPLTASLAASVTRHRCAGPAPRRRDDAPYNGTGSRLRRPGPSPSRPPPPRRRSPIHSLSLLGSRQQTRDGSEIGCELQKAGPPLPASQATSLTMSLFLTATRYQWCTAGPLRTLPSAGRHLLDRHGGSSTHRPMQRAQTPFELGPFDGVAAEGDRWLVCARGARGVAVAAEQPARPACSGWSRPSVAPPSSGSSSARPATCPVGETDGDRAVELDHGEGLSLPRAPSSSAICAWSVTSASGAWICRAVIRPGARPRRVAAGARRGRRVGPPGRALIPQRAVLLAERDVRRLGLRGRPGGVVQQHQRRQSPDLGVVGHGRHSSSPSRQSPSSHSSRPGTSLSPSGGPAPPSTRSGTLLQHARRRSASCRRLGTGRGCARLRSSALSPARSVCPWLALRRGLRGRPAVVILLQHPYVSATRSDRSSAGREQAKTQPQLVVHDPGLIIPHHSLRTLKPRGGQLGQPLGGDLDD